LPDMRVGVVTSAEEFPEARRRRVIAVVKLVP
jgi:hypothetical protein